MKGNPNPSPSSRFQPGNTLGGRGVGARNKLSEHFFEVLKTDFEVYGPAAILAMRANDPSGYVAMVARLMPANLEAKLQVQHTGPKSVSASEWEIVEQITRVIERAAPGADRERVFDALEQFLRSELAEPVAIEALPAPIACPVPLPSD
jgi:hypothetical protein